MKTGHSSAGTKDNKKHKDNNQPRRSSRLLSHQAIGGARKLVQVCEDVPNPSKIMVNQPRRSSRINAFSGMKITTGAKNVHWGIRDVHDEGNEDTDEQDDEEARTILLRQEEEESTSEEQEEES